MSESASMEVGWEVVVPSLYELLTTHFDKKNVYWRKKLYFTHIKFWPKSRDFFQSIHLTIIASYGMYADFFVIKLVQG